MISILVIGNELLSGQVHDVNITHMLAQFGASGHRVREVRIVADEVLTISQAIRELSASSDWVVTSGGLGPTHDDVTMRAFADAFDCSLTLHPGMEQRMRSFFADKITAGHLRMAMLPDQAQLIDTKTTSWPLIKVANCFALPGLPELFVRKFDALLKLLPTQPHIFIASLDVKEPESQFAAELEMVQQEFSEIEIGSYPSGMGQDAWTKITCKSPDIDKVKQCFESLSALFSKRNSILSSSTATRFRPGPNP